MSHNKIQIAGQSPGIDGTVSVDLNHLDNIGTIENDLVLQYNSGQWATGIPRFTNKTLYYNWKKTAGATDFNSGQQYTNSSKFWWIVNTNFSWTQYKDSSVTVNMQQGSSNYAESLTLGTAGTYLFVASCAMGFNTYWNNINYNESMDIQWSDGTPFGAKSTVYAGYQKGSTIWGIKTISANTTVYIDISNTQSNPQNAESEQSGSVSICVYKI